MSIPRTQRSRAISAPTASRAPARRSCLERVAAHPRARRSRRGHRAPFLRAALRARDTGRASHGRPRPRARSAVETHVVAEQQRPDSLPRAHQIPTDVLPGPDEVAQRLLGDRRDPNRRTSPAISSRTNRSASRRSVFTPDPAAPRAIFPAPRPRTRSRPPERASQPVPGRARLVRRPRSRQPAKNATTSASSARQPTASAAHPKSPSNDAASTASYVHIQTSPAANLNHGRFLLCGCGRRAGCHPHG